LWSFNLLDEHLREQWRPFEALERECARVDYGIDLRPEAVCGDLCALFEDRTRAISRITVANSRRASGCV
jgi:hypothetical protein